MSDQLHADWNTAAAAAGVDPDDVVLYPLAPTSRHSAMHFPPGLWPPPRHDTFAFTDEHRAALYDLRDRHVLVVSDTLAAPQRVLVLNHEAEHVGQHDASPGVSGVSLWLSVALPWDWLYFAMPHERDADAAATRFAGAQNIRGAPDDLEGTDRFLYAAPWPPPDRESLPLRLLAFTLFYPDDFDLACRANQCWPNVDPDALIDGMIESGSAARAELRDLFAGFVEGVANHGITDDQWNAMTRAERNAVSDGLRARVVEAEAGAVQQLRDILGH